MTSTTFKTLFDSFSVTVSKSKLKKLGGVKQAPNPYTTMIQYYNIFDLILSYTFVAGGLALIITVVLGFLSLPPRERRAGTYARMAVTGVAGLGLCLIALVRFNYTLMYRYLGSAWMIPTICLTLFFCVLINHIRVPMKAKAH